MTEERKGNFRAVTLLLSLIVINVLAITFVNHNNNNNTLTDIAVYAQQSSAGDEVSASCSGNGSVISAPNSSSMPYVGVNMQGLYISLEGLHANSKSTNSQPPDERSLSSTVHFPPNYYDDSFRIISQGGMNHVRLVLYWEAYEKNPAAFIAELNIVAQTADKYGLKVMYDNHQFHTSLWLDNRRGTGFPPSLFENNPTLYPYGSGGSTGYPAATVWWTNWWNRSIKDASGVDGWTLQANFLKKIVTTVDRHPSTLGYEILNEPQVHSISQWSKIGTYNTFMVNQLRTLTHKTIAYSMNIPIDLKSPIGVTPQNLAKMAPANKTNVIFKISMYGVPADNNYQQKRLDIFTKAAQLAGVPLYIGEWNNVRRVRAVPDVEDQDLANQNFTTSPQLSDINQEQANAIVQRLKEIKAWGMAFWIWDYAHSRIPSYNLINITSSSDNIDLKINTTKYFDILKNAYATIHND
jgi:Cellulase (glycosyl hydrolase family 5)